MSDRINSTYATPLGQPVTGQYVYASNFSVLASVNDVTLVLHDTLPVADLDGISADSEIRRAIAIVKMSPQSAKELAALLHDAIVKYEKLYNTTLVTGNLRG